MATSQSSQDAVGRDTVGHDVVGHDAAAEAVERVRRMLANPRRTRR